MVGETENIDADGESSSLAWAQGMEKGRLFFNPGNSADALSNFGNAGLDYPTLSPNGRFPLSRSPYSGLRSFDPGTSPSYGAPQWKAGGRYNPDAISADDGKALVEFCNKHHLKLQDMLGIIYRETAGSMSPDKTGPYVDKMRQVHRDIVYAGLIMFSPDAQKKYGWRPGQTFREQLFGPVEAFLIDRFKSAGMQLDGAECANLYASILAGDPRKINAADVNGSALQAVPQIVRFAPQAAQKLGINLNAPSLIGGNQVASLSPTGGLTLDAPTSVPQTLNQENIYPIGDSTAVQYRASLGLPTNVSARGSTSSETIFNEFVRNIGDIRGNVVPLFMGSNAGKNDQAYMEAAARWVQARGGTAVFIGVGPISMQRDSTTGGPRGEAVNKRILEAARNTGAGFLMTPPAYYNYDSNSAYGSDYGVHRTAAGNRYISNNLLDAARNPEASREAAARTLGVPVANSTTKPATKDTSLHLSV